MHTYTATHTHIRLATLSTVEFEFPKGTMLAVASQVLPKSYKRPAFNIISVGFLIDFRRKKPRIFFRRTSRKLSRFFLHAISVRDFQLQCWCNLSGRSASTSSFWTPAATVTL